MNGETSEIISKIKEGLQTNLGDWRFVVTAELDVFVPFSEQDIKCVMFSIRKKGMQETALPKDCSEIRKFGKFWLDLADMIEKLTPKEEKENDLREM
ncbi:MAG: hypothetical protein QXL51_01265 [Candidatus Aenigmatarchaeota archaeon]